MKGYSLSNMKKLNLSNKKSIIGFSQLNMKKENTFEKNLTTGSSQLNMKRANISVQFSLMIQRRKMKLRKKLKKTLLFLWKKLPKRLKDTKMRVKDIEKTLKLKVSKVTCLMIQKGFLKLLKSNQNS